MEWLGGLVLDEHYVSLHLPCDAGVHEISGIGDNLFADEQLETQSTRFPYLGGRLGLMFHLGSSRVFSLGAWLMGRFDLGHRQVRIEGHEGTFFGGGYTEGGIHETGGHTVVAAFRLGVALP